MYQIISKRLLISLVVLFLLDVTFLPIISIGSAKISLLSLMVLYVAFDWGWKKALPVAILVGLFKDLYGSPFLGMETFSLVFMTIVFERALRKVDKNNVLLRLFISFLFLLLYQVLNYFLLAISGKLSVFAWHQIGTIVMTALYNVVVFPIFFKVALFVFKEQRRFHQYELFDS